MVHALSSVLVFDFDGVLADTERLHMGAFQKVFAARGWALDEHEYFDRYLGCDDHGLVVAFARDHGLVLGADDVQRLAAEKTSEFARYLENGDVLFAGAAACVEALAGRYRLGIASGALHEEIVTILGAANLLHHFPVIVAAEDVNECKPSPVPYLAAAARIGVDPRVCVAVEDSVPGLQAARAAGMRTIGITTTSPRDALRLADRVINSLSELSPELIDELAAGSRRDLAT
jgi:beta-phosphoglucomutase-like phosphatase (HAD superfamily)